MTTNDAYAQLLEKLKRVHLLGTVSELLGWDEQVNLPAGGAEQRAAQSAALADVQHAALSDPRLGEALAQLEAEAATLTADQRVVIREARKDYDRATRLPAEFVREKAELCSRAYHAWEQARPKSDFASYAPFLEKHVALAKREAGYLGWGERPYDYMLDLHDPGMTVALIEPLFAELKAGLVPLVRTVLASPKRSQASALRGFPVDKQSAFLREVTERMGFDFQHGRIDVSTHPFCSGTGADIRMTTRFAVDNPLDSLFSAIHETGHGLYEQGLPAEHAGTALGIAAGMGVHESQSRLWENQVARSRAFWRFFEPKWRAAFSEQTAALSSEALYREINAVRPTLIRVDSDEVTYNLHILLRFDLERRLFSGELAVADLPAAWSELSQSLLGRAPSCHREGVLQDVHWSGGAFGYFPSYTLGNMMAAQLWYRAQAALPGLESDFESGNFARLLGWLRKEVHGRGRRYTLPQLVERVTGAPLSPAPLLRYLSERYLPLAS